MEANQTADRMPRNVQRKVVHPELRHRSPESFGVNIVSQEALIVQFKTDGSVTDFDRLIEIEDALIQGFSQNGKAEVDGHDSGSGTMNIFVIPKGSWSAVIEVVMTHLKHRGVLKDATIAKRKKSGSYAVVWPSDFAGDFQL